MIDYEASVGLREAQGGTLVQPLFQPSELMKTGGSSEFLVEIFTTECSETPSATLNWLVKKRLKHNPAHFNTMYKRNEGWLRKAEGLISPTTFRVRINEVSLEVLHVPRYDSILNHHGFLTRQLNGTSV